MIPGVAVTVKGDYAVVEVLDRKDKGLRGRVFQALLFVADRPQDIQLLTRPNRAYLVPVSLIPVLDHLDHVHSAAEPSDYDDTVTEADKAAIAAWLTAESEYTDRLKLEATEREADDQAAASRKDAAAQLENPPAKDPESPQQRGARTRAARKAAALADKAQ